ncbi:MAG: tRNA uridine-5-carboxymethylaminomethyl(34) synthesis GTPase MnmE, partial [Clostridiales bacterium]|nr:tRNA uridine-5-carboxymethylaminomethyl(34) synthesis GTPase MnmE [Clostridiales bacterium]
ISEVPTHTIHYGYIHDGDELIDEVMIIVMKGPKSYTKEDVVEIDCHGGIVVTKKILDTVIKHGARLADPGEFTKRAFLNGRIDLSQAEAVMDIINSKNELSLKNSLNQLKGNVLDRIQELRKNIMHDLAYIEAALDDPEHMTLDGFNNELEININNTIKELNILLKSAENGRLIKEGINTVILGKPNVGKSSLLNILVGSDRAIVTDIAGTTRDTLEESVNIGGISLNIIDTAGIRDTDDVVEKIGVEKARKVADEADLIIYVIDASVPLDINDEIIMDIVKDRKSLVLLNKTDLDMKVDQNKISKILDKDIIQISAKENVGIDKLEKWIIDNFFQGNLEFNDDVMITNIRQKNAISNAIESLNNVIISIHDNLPEDFYSIDLMNAYELLGEIIGETVNEDLVDTIFSEFCMGK